MNSTLPPLNNTKTAKAGLISLCLLLLAFSNNKFDGEGKAIMVPDRIPPLGQGEITIRYLVGEHGINVGGGIKASFPKRWKSQNERPQRNGFIKVSLSRKESGHKLTVVHKDRSLDDVAKKHVYVITVIITKKPLVAGDTISVTYLKRRSNKTPAYTQTVPVASDGDGDGNYTLIKDLPEFTIRSGPPQKIYAIAPTDQQVGEEFNLKIAVLDSSYNAVNDYSGTIEFTSSDMQARLPGPYTFSVGDGGTKRFPVILNTPGYHTVSVSEKSGDLKGVSNPLDCRGSAPQKKVWWGDIHSHTEISQDGMGNGSFKYARDVACLDFYSLTDHFSNINAKDWDFTKQQTIRFHRPNEFVTILAYETSMFTPSGHYNVFFNCSNEVIPRIPLVRQRQLRTPDGSKSILKLWEFLEKKLPPGTDAITIPHHTGIFWGKHNDGVLVNFDKPYRNPKRRVAIEIFSKHGTSEKYDVSSPLSYQNWLHPILGKRANKTFTRHFPYNGPHYAQDAWAKKVYLGTIAATDDHEAHPGMPGKSTPYYPLAAVYANGLTRNAIFNAIKKRETYATTGERIILNFKLNGHPMGSEVILPKGVKPAFSVTARGTDLIDYVEILKWDFTYGKFDKDNHPIFEAVLHNEVKALDTAIEFVDENYKDHSLYYVRLKQLRTVTDHKAWAWSSPIWVKK